MRKLGPKCAPAVIDSFEAADGWTIVMEDCGETLLDIAANPLRPLTGGEVKDVARQLFKAAAFLHLNCIFHGDLKLENVVVSRNGAVKLIDFGMSEVMRPNQTSARGCGSANYRAPEVLMRRPHSLKADVWALGVTLHGFATGEFPFHSSPQGSRAAGRVIAGRPNLDRLRATRGDDLAELVAEMLSAEPENRPTVQDCLAHKWFHVR